MICQICQEEYINQTETEPAEPCSCGEMAWAAPYKWDGLRGIKNWMRYFVVRQCYKLADFMLNNKYS